MISTMYVLDNDESFKIRLKVILSISGTFPEIVIPSWSDNKISDWAGTAPMYDESFVIVTHFEAVVTFA